MAASSSISLDSGPRISGADVDSIENSVAEERATLLTKTRTRRIPIAGILKCSRENCVSKCRQNGISTVSYRTAPAVEFDLGGSFPISEISIAFPPNRLLLGTLESRSTTNRPWRRQVRETFYALERDGLELRPQSVQLRGTRDRYWRISEIDPAPSIEFPIHLDVAWRAQELLFIAQGSGPYQLAVGRGPDVRKTVSFATAFAKIADPNLIGSASVGTSIALPAQNKLVLAGVFPWGRWML